MLKIISTGKRNEFIVTLPAKRSMFSKNFLWGLFCATLVHLVPACVFTIRTLINNAAEDSQSIAYVLHQHFDADPNASTTNASISGENNFLNKHPWLVPPHEQINLSTIDTHPFVKSFIESIPSDKVFKPLTESFNQKHHYQFLEGPSIKTANSDKLSPSLQINFSGPLTRYRAVHGNTFIQIPLTKRRFFSDFPIKLTYNVVMDALRGEIIAAELAHADTFLERNTSNLSQYAKAIESYFPQIFLPFKNSIEKYHEGFLEISYYP